MGTNTNVTRMTLDERINGVVKDGPDILVKLSKLTPKDNEPIEIVTELPAATDPDIILGYVRRWRDIQLQFKRDLRVYAWSYDTKVEKYILGCTQNMSHVHVTVLPMYLKETKSYG